MKPIVVQKYGGSSLADLDKVRAVAKRIVDTVEAGHRVVAVVSAMGGTTDALLAQAKTLSQSPTARELDMLLSVGERIATALLAIAIDELGHDAVSFTGSQSGIITNTRHNRARIIEVRPYRLLDELDQDRIVIVAGYQGVSYAREITTLGRGGTDTTAVALAAALEAEHCEICSDVDGVYTADPRVVVDARRLDELSHEEMVALSRHGARVLNQDCVEYASQHGVALFAKASFGPRDDKGTVVRMNPAREAPAVTAIAHRYRVAELQAGPDVSAAELVTQMASEGVFPSASARADDGSSTWVLALDDAHRLDTLTTRLTSMLGDRVAMRSDRGTVTVIGHGLGEEPDLLRRAVACVEELAGPGPFTLGPLALSFRVPTDKIDEVVSALHRALLA